MHKMSEAGATETEVTVQDHGVEEGPSQGFVLALWCEVQMHIVRVSLYTRTSDSILSLARRFLSSVRRHALENTCRTAKSIQVHQRGAFGTARRRDADHIGQRDR